MSKVSPPSEFRGKKTPKILEAGPVKRHGCTDLLCFIIFAGFWVGMVFIAIYGFSKGNPVGLVAAYDQFGKPCGLDDQVGHPYLFFIRGTDGQLNITGTVCVSQCPATATSPIDCADDYDRVAKCSSVVPYPTVIFANKICLPTNTNDALTLTNAQAVSFDLRFEAVSDLLSCWWIIICVGLIGIFFGFIYMVFMRFCPGVVTWGLIVLYELVLILFGALCFLETTKNSIVEDITPTALSSISPLALKIISGACFLVAIVSMIVMCIFRTKIRLAVAVFQAAGEFVQDNISTLMLPPLFFILSLIFYIFWIFTLIYLLGANDINPQPNNPPFASVSWNGLPEWLFFFLILALIWNHSFFHALPQFVISSAACLWYFRKAQPHKYPICLSIFRAVLHIGSIAMGALMVGLVEFLKIFFMPFEKCLMSAKENKKHCCQKYCLTCFRACLLCFEGCIKFIDKHVYVQIAMTGKGYCESTKESFYLIKRNKLRFGTIHGLGIVFIFFGQVFITLLTTISGYMIISNASYFKQKLFTPVFLTIFFCLVSLIVGHSFMCIYGVAADTIIHCYAMDDELHDEWAKYAPDSIRKLASKQARQRVGGSDSLSQSHYSNLSD